MVRSDSIQPEAPSPSSGFGRLAGTPPTYSGIRRSSERTKCIFEPNKLKLEAATIKWSPAPRAKTIELVLRTKADQLNMVRLLRGVCAQGPTAQERLAEVLEDEVAAAALIELLLDKDRLQQALGLEGANQ